MPKDRVDFLIVGAMKAGTSSLMDVLVQHPDVAIPRREIHFFDEETRFARGYDWYHAQLDMSRPDVMVGEKCPPYCLDPQIAERIRDYNPDIRPIWILRDPVKRAISNFYHTMSRRGLATPAIEQSLAQADALRAINHPTAYLYRSQYDQHLAYFDPLFRPEQQYVMIMEELLANPQAEAQRLFAWLGLDGQVPIRLPHTNKTRATLQRFNPIPEATRNRLRAHLAPTVAAVEARLGRKIAAWNAAESKPPQTTGREPHIDGILERHVSGADLSNRLLVVVSDAGTGSFAFQRETEHLGEDRLYLRDPTGMGWSHCVTEGNPDTERVTTQIAQNARDYEEIWMMGAGMGASAALRFGARLGVAKVLAFDPRPTQAGADADLAALLRGATRTQITIAYGGSDAEVQDMVKQLFQPDGLPLHMRALCYDDQGAGLLPAIAHAVGLGGFIKQVMTENIVPEIGIPVSDLVPLGPNKD